ncbi:MAG: hypothetical protein M3R04_05445 [bacterium]|nr:hypothetical protein [bacterium]
MRVPGYVVDDVCWDGAGLGGVTELAIEHDINTAAAFFTGAVASDAMGTQEAQEGGKGAFVHLSP